MYVNKNTGKVVTVETVLNKTTLSDKDKLKVTMSAFYSVKAKMKQLEMIRLAEPLDIRRTVRPRFSLWKFLTGQMYTKRQQKYVLSDGTFIWKDIDTNVFEDEIEEE